MTAPAPRNHPAEDAHPAPAPAPVAVPTPALEAVLDEAEERARNQSGTCTGEHCEGCESGRRVTRARAELAALSRPESVVAPLPSEAITDAAVDAAARALYNEEQAESMGFDQWPDYDHPDNVGKPIYEHHAKETLAAALPYLRLVPEDDEDTVRVLDCGHIYPDGTRCTLDRATHEDIPGLVDLHRDGTR